MTRRNLLCLSAVLVATASLAAAKPNFSGDWTLNTEKSNFGPMPGPAKMTRKIAHTEPTLKLATTQVGPQGEVTSELSYTTDGKESVNKVRGSDVKSVAKWDGDALVVDSKREVPGMGEITQKENWSLSGDGKTLTINNHINTPQGEFDITIVFNKQ